MRAWSRSLGAWEWEVFLMKKRVQKFVYDEGSYEESKTVDLETMKVL